jgi:hypothetical protein
MAMEGPLLFGAGCQRGIELTIGYFVDVGLYLSILASSSFEP